MSNQNELEDFLLARIAEDEAAAREWSAAYNNPGPVPAYHYATARRHRQEWPTLWGSLDHFTPTRVLAECAAKRIIIERAKEASEVEEEFDDYMLRGAGPRRREPLTGGAILFALAAVYKEHPDYRPEWAA